MDDPLIKALREYARPRYDIDTPLMTYVVQVDAGNGRKMAITVERACAAAADRLDKGIINDLKFRALVAGLRECGAGSLYERIMREPMPEFDKKP